MPPSVHAHQKYNNSLPLINTADLLVVPYSLLALHVYDRLKSDNIKLFSVNVELVDSPLTVLLVVVAGMLSLLSLLHVMIGVGIPIAIQVNVTSSPNNTVLSSGGIVMIGIAT